MATLLNGVNEALKRLQIINSDLSTLTSGGKQIPINIAIQVWNELVDELYSLSSEPFPEELASSSITLTASDRDYSLASDLNQLRYPLIDQTNGDYITEYPGGYLQMVVDQTIPSDYTGLPQNASIRETDGELYLDRIPTSTESGKVFTYWYDKDLELTLLTDTFPFKDVVFRALVPAATELIKSQMQNKFSRTAFDKSISRAAKYLTQKQERESWLPKRSNAINTDPLNAD